jgi:hypothetical protein
VVKTFGGEKYLIHVCTAILQSPIPIACNV